MRRAIRYGLWAMSYGLVALAGCGGERGGVYDARGTVEVHEVDLAPVAPARVLAIRVDEGATVAAGDTLALLTQTDLPATLSVQRARLAMAEANLRDLLAGARPQEIRQAQAALEAAESQATWSRQALDRARSLVANHAISRQQYDDAVAANRKAEAQLAEAREALALARAGTRPERVQAARAEVTSAAAAVRQVEAHAADLVLVAPVAGIVLGRHAEPGEALGPNVPVLTVGETGRPYVRVFVPQAVVSTLAVGAAVEIIPAAGPGLQGRVAAINPKAEFTPRVALTEQERADLMFGVKVEFADPAAAPHPGLWVTVRIPRMGVGE